MNKIVISILFLAILTGSAFAVPSRLMHGKVISDSPEFKTPPLKVIQEAYINKDGDTDYVGVLPISATVSTAGLATDTGQADIITSIDLLSDTIGYNNTLVISDSVTLTWINNFDASDSVVNTLKTEKVIFPKGYLVNEPMTYDASGNLIYKPSL